MNGSLEIDFSTFRENVAGTGATDGDALYANFPDVSPTIRASIIDESSDGCKVGSGTDIVSGGYNVEEAVDLDCGLDAPTDFHGADGLNALSQNGSRPIGAPFNAPLFPGVVPLTNAFVDDTGPAHDTVPPAQCKVDGKAVRVDARGAPRRDDGCDAGAVERTLCGPAVVFGVGSFIGTGKKDNTGFPNGTQNIVRGFGGNDQFFTFDLADYVCGDQGSDSIYPGTGDDRVVGGPGRDLVGYVAHPTGVEVDLAAGTATGSGTDLIFSIEDVEGSDNDDSLLGDTGKNFLFGRDGADTLEGRGGIDFLDAKDGEADVLIDCGPGKNSKEKVRFDQGLDPDPISC
jgi:Ca2+-binding RTX toxin-like protein